MVHAGILPGWSIDKALELGAEVEAALAAPQLPRLPADACTAASPTPGATRLAGWDRLRVIVNAMTRMRFCSREGRMELDAKGAKAPRGYRPWFETRPASEKTTIVFGHWSQLGLKVRERQRWARQRLRLGRQADRAAPRGPQALCRSAAPAIRLPAGVTECALEARFDLVARRRVVLRAAVRDLDRAHHRGEPAGVRPVPAVRDAVEQAGAIGVAAAGRIDHRCRLARRESRGACRRRR